MPVSPDYGARLTAQVVQVVSDAELAVLRTLVRYLRADLDAPSWATSKLASLGAFRGDLVARLAAVDAQLAQAVNTAILQAYQAGSAFAVGELDLGGVRAFAPASQAAVQVLARDTLDLARQFTPRVTRTVADVYQQVVSEASGTVVLGAQTRREAAQAALDRLVGDGIGGFTDRSGRAWRAESYVEMAVRTTAGQAAVAGHEDTLVASGHDLVTIIAGPRACPICDGWEGRVLSLTGGTTDYVANGRRGRVDGTLAQAKAAGVFHPNCRCSLGAYIPGVSPEPTTDRPDPQGYADQQEQRRLERKVREWKRREALALDDATERAAGVKVREWQARLRQHLAEHTDLKRQRHREQVGRAI